MCSFRKIYIIISDPRASPDERKRWVPAQSGSIGAFNTTWSQWPQITHLVPNLSEGIHWIVNFAICFILRCPEFSLKTIILKTFKRFIPASDSFQQYMEKPFGRDGNDHPVIRVIKRLLYLTCKSWLQLKQVFLDLLQHHVLLWWRYKLRRHHCHPLELSSSHSPCHAQLEIKNTICLSCRLIHFTASLRASSPGSSGGGAGKGRRRFNYVSGIWILPPILLWPPVDWARSGNERECKQTLKNTFQG